MSDDYNPNSVDATLARLEAKHDAFHAETREYRKHNDAKHEQVLSRLTDLEGERKRLKGIAIGAGLGAGGLGTAIAKFFSSGNQ